MNDADIADIKSGLQRVHEKLDKIGKQVATQQAICDTERAAIHQLARVVKGSNGQPGIQTELALTQQKVKSLSRWGWLIAGAVITLLANVIASKAFGDEGSVLKSHDVRVSWYISEATPTDEYDDWEPWLFAKLGVVYLYPTDGTENEIVLGGIRFFAKTECPWNTYEYESPPGLEYEGEDAHWSCYAYDSSTDPNLPHLRGYGASESECCEALLKHWDRYHGRRTRVPSNPVQPARLNGDPLGTYAAAPVR